MTVTISETTPDQRECMLGGETRKRGILGSWGWKGVAIIIGYLFVAVLLTVTTKSVPVVVVLVAIPALVWVTTNRISAGGESFLLMVRDSLIGRLGARSGTSRFEPGLVASDGRIVLPLEVGSVEFMGVSRDADRAELAVVRHGASHFTSTLEIVGGGDGLREQSEIDRFGLKFGRLLYAVSRADIPVDQLDMSTRVVPVDSSDYDRWVEDNVAEGVSSRLVDNLRELAGRVGSSGESYRTFLTMSMPIDQLAKRAALLGKVDSDSLAEAAYDVTGQVAREATRQGYHVQQGLTPTRLAGLIRHQYVPSIAMEDVTGLDSPRAAWPAYDGTHREAVEVHGPDGSTWWHATVSVPRDGWPLRPVGVRWLESLVTDISPTMIRTVTVQHRLQPKQATRSRAVLANTLDTADVMAQEKRQQTSTGEREAQQAGSRLLLHDLLYESASGDVPQLRVTISARSREELVTARQQIEAAMQDCEITRVHWYDHRQHHAHLLTLPLGRGIQR